jgi:hypothetical protein
MKLKIKADDEDVKYLYRASFLRFSLPQRDGPQRLASEWTGGPPWLWCSGVMSAEAGGVVSAAVSMQS